MILDMDVGNSRIKWRLSEDGEIIDTGAMPSFAASFDTFHIGRKPDRIRVASVAGSDVTERIRSWASAQGIEPRFARTVVSCAGVTCGYEAPETMGVDRWLALLAAWDTLKTPCVVVCAGSALTVDVLGDNGVHRGGYIVPGLAMMIRSLSAGTAGVQAGSLTAQSLQPGRNTGEAVHRGCLRMAVAFIETVPCRETGENAPLVLAGGDAGILARYLPGPHVHVCPYLVLDGLGLALP